MIVRLGAVRILIETLPPPVTVRRRWDGGPQAYPVTLPAVMRSSMAGFAQLTAIFSGSDFPARRRRPDYLRRHL